jgi:hypothetical protein
MTRWLANESLLGINFVFLLVDPTCDLLQQPDFHRPMARRQDSLAAGMPNIFILR